MDSFRTIEREAGRARWRRIYLGVLAVVLLSVTPDKVMGDDLQRQDPAAKGHPHAGYCWAQEERWCPPDFEAYFPDDREGALALGEFWRADDRDRRLPGEALAVVRAGLRRFGGDPEPIVRWVGKRYVWKQASPDGDAIELLYHAAGHREAADGLPGIRAAAIHSGLSVLRPKPPAVLRALVAIAMGDENPEILSRIAWGMGAQTRAALACLTPYVSDEDPAVREKAQVVRDILSHKLKAFDWAEARHREHLEQNYRAALPRIYAVLHEGDSAARRQVLREIEQENVMPIMGVSGIQAFGASATDPDPEIRETVARMAGQFWIGKESEPHPDAIALQLQLSRDGVRAVRVASLFHGLCAVRSKDETVMRRILELTFEDGAPAMAAQVCEALRTQKDDALEVLEEYIGGSDLAFSVAAREFRMALTRMGSGG